RRCLPVGSCPQPVSRSFGRAFGMGRVTSGADEAGKPFLWASEYIRGFWSVFGRLEPLCVGLRAESQASEYWTCLRSELEAGIDCKLAVQRGVAASGTGKRPRGSLCGHAADSNGRGFCVRFQTA